MKSATERNRIQTLTILVFHDIEVTGSDNVKSFNFSEPVCSPFF